MGRLILFPKDPWRFCYTDFYYFMKYMSSRQLSYCCWFSQMLDCRLVPFVAIFFTNLQNVYFWKGLGMSLPGEKLVTPLTAPRTPWWWSSKIQSPVTQSSGPVPTGYHALPPHQPFLLCLRFPRASFNTDGLVFMLYIYPTLITGVHWARPCPRHQGK